MWPTVLIWHLSQILHSTTGPYIVCHLEDGATSTTPLPHLGQMPHASADWMPAVPASCQIWAKYLLCGKLSFSISILIQKPFCNSCTALHFILYFIVYITYRLLHTFFPFLQPYFILLFLNLFIFYFVWFISFLISLTLQVQCLICILQKD